MLSPRAQAPTANPDGGSAPEVSLGGQTRWYRTGTSRNRGRLRQKTGLLMLFGVGRQSYSTYQMRADGCLSGECRLIDLGATQRAGPGDLIDRVSEFVH